MTQPSYDAIHDAQGILNGHRALPEACVPDAVDWGGLTDDTGIPHEYDQRPSAVRAEVEQETPDLFQRGGGFVLDVPPTPPAVWGDGDHVIWAEGEAFMIAAPQGVGKTTVALQLVRALLGLQEKVLGYTVQPASRKILYLAMDRPAQMRRAANRIFTEDDRVLLNERLVIWSGPPPYDMAQRKDMLAVMALRAGADIVVVDSLKDAAVGLAEDAIGAGYNRTRQQAIVEGVQVVELHHTRKTGANGSEPNTLADVFGSVWLTSGAGSVVSLWGDAGDPVVSWRHLKQPMSEVGPFKVVHDQENGTSQVEAGVDLFRMIRRAGVQGLTAVEYAVALFETVKPTASQREKARRRLDRKVADGLISSVPGDRSLSRPSRYFMTALGASQTLHE